MTNFLVAALLITTLDASDRVYAERLHGIAGELEVSGSLYSVGLMLTAQDVKKTGPGEPEGWLYQQSLEALVGPPGPVPVRVGVRKIWRQIHVELYDKTGGEIRWLGGLDFERDRFLASYHERSSWYSLEYLSKREPIRVRLILDYWKVGPDRLKLISVLAGWAWSGSLRDR